MSANIGGDKFCNFFKCRYKKKSDLEKKNYEREKATKSLIS
ncbi:unnamed protein product [Bemisia tabaci]|uniref:Uncharacterized protein n=1 Tax=Bemisia tabaci TaxID=7038 RepID=A0A9P0F4Y3_BEMTA|nr:unnamed protein product [Bemisia tabaci]